MEEDETDSPTPNKQDHHLRRAVTVMLEDPRNSDLQQNKDYTKSMIENNESSNSSNVFARLS